MKISLKAHPELRHVIAHMIYAIRANAEGNHSEALYEVDQIEGLVFWEDDDSMTNHIEGIQYGKVQQSEEENVQIEEVLQGQEKDLQG